MVVLPIMARLLGPAAFGLVALAMPFILFANMLSDAGLGSALVRVPRPSARLESTIFWLAVGLGACLALATCLGAAPIGALMRQPRLAPVLVALSPILLMSSSLSVANARISRERRFAVFAVGDLLSLTLSSAAAIGAASAGAGAWSLVIQQLSLWGAKVAWVQAASRFRPSFVCDLRSTRELLAFGLNKVGADIAEFMGKTAPTIVIGGFLGVLAVGHYSMAYQLIRTPELILSGPLYLATFTAVAGLAATTAGPAELALRNLRIIATALAPIFFGLALVSDLLVAVFLGPKWTGTSQILSALAPAGLLICLYSVVGAVLMGVGRSDMQLRLSLLCGLGMLAGAAIGSRWSVEMATIGVTAGAAIAAPANVATLARHLGISNHRVIASVAWPFLASGLMAVAVGAGRGAMGSARPLLELGACVLVGALVFAGVLAAVNGRQIAADLRQFLPAKSAVDPRPA
jgi:PST family polysaccharide transporter